MAALYIAGSWQLLPLFSAHNNQQQQQQILITGNTVHGASVLEIEENLNSFVGSRLMPYAINNKIPKPNVGIFQINDVSAFAGIGKFRV
jgi:hypothetical protein